MAKKSRRRRTSVPAQAPRPAAAASAAAPASAARSPVLTSTILCNYGCVMYASEAEHRAYLDALPFFIDEIIEEQALEIFVLKKHSDALKDLQSCLCSHSHLDPERIIQTFVGMSTEMVLSFDSIFKTKEEQDGVFRHCRLNGTVILHLSAILRTNRGELLTVQEQLSVDGELTKLHDCDKETVKFFAKRITCNCLKPLLAVASDKETGICSENECNVKSGVGGRTLLLCSGCKALKYCSQECQRKHWAEHKEACHRIRKYREKES